MTIIEAELAAWFTGTGPRPDPDLKKEEFISRLTYTKGGTDMSGLGWYRVGVAKIAITTSEDSTAELESLRAQRKMVLARAEEEVGGIDRRMKSLLETTMEGDSDES